MNAISGVNYINEKNGVSYGRLLVQPVVRPEIIADNGLVIPQDAGKICEEGIVASVCPGSKFNLGDSVLYRMVDRINRNEYDFVLIDGVEYDAILESEVWSVNEKPHNRIFVEPISEISIGENEIIIPDNVKGIPQKGIVVEVGFNSSFSVGDTIEYRKQEQSIYPTVTLNGRTLDILFDNDVFTVNGVAATHRIIVKIDISAQRIKQNTTDSGIALSPLFQFMLRNLQYGQVVGIGAEAQLKFPELEVGDIAILHHIIESQPYRLLKQETGKYDNITYEYRVINTQDIHSREIFGKLCDKNFSFDSSSHKRVTRQHIIPFDKNIFLKWEFSTLEEKQSSDSVFIDMDFNLTGADNIEDFRNLVSHKKEQSVKKYKMKFGSLVAQLRQLDPTIPEHKERGDILEAEIAELQREIAKKSIYINSNHLLRCKIAHPKQVPNEILTPFMQLYPINILGQKYLIGNLDLIIANMIDSKIVPYGIRVLVLPVEDEKSLIEIPDSARERPQKGKVISIGSKVDEPIEEGDIVIYKKMVGTDIVLDKVSYLMLTQNDLLGNLSLAQRVGSLV